jgi:hypothetical protein
MNSGAAILGVRRVSGQQSGPVRGCWLAQIPQKAVRFPKASQKYLQTPQVPSGPLDYQLFVRG